ncbi:heavy metal translocating P-type ATPase [Parapedobacter lycopersici]|uniref:heavy metal translocating P-type ATPase n=1 Tax=Parapedobacter lycopersici TaxID=1864939 RepID=UPI00214D69C2|nr:heavy metal translocating P-type ATPase [Parapedobacter lycopersici]
MKKVTLQIPLVLPHVPDEKDRCVDQLVNRLRESEGLEKVHIQVQDSVPLLCLHYDPEKITIDRVRSLAQKAGAAISEQFGHALIEVQGIRHTRHARHIAAGLQAVPGILEAAVSASGMVRLEYDATQTDASAIHGALRRMGLEIIDPEVPAARFLTVSAGGKDEAAHVHGEGEAHEGAHHHTHGGLFGKNTELFFSLLCGALLGIGFGLSFAEAVPAWVSLTLYIGAYFFGGFYTAREAVQTIARGSFEIDFLMLVAAIGAAILGEWAEGALLLFLFSLGHALEHYAMDKARKSIAALADLAPKKALRKQNGQTVEVRIDELRVGDIIVVKPNTKIAADGVVVAGSGSVNQAPITGESMPVDKEPVSDAGKDWSAETNISDVNRVFSGTLNGNSTLEVQVTRAASDSTLSRLVKLVNEAQTQQSPTQQFTDKFEKYFVPAVLILVVLLNFAFLVIDEDFADSFYRSMAVLVAASPCALAISTPSAVLSGVARAARSGVLIKGGRPLEDLGVLTALAFDKTGTLTEGKPKLTQVVTLAEMDETALLKAAVAVEALSDHPLAKAIVRDGTERLKGMDIPVASQLEAVLGKGIKATLGTDTVYIGNVELYQSLDGPVPPAGVIEQVQSLESAGNTTMLIRKNEQYVGIIALMDTPRPEAAPTLKRLERLGIRRMVMLTGDNQHVADAVAAQIGLTDAWGSLLPEEKVAAVQRLRQEVSRVAMVGDGVNDAPAMANSTVGIAMGAAGSDVALETADIALMGDKLETLPFAIGLSRKAKRIIRQNLWMSLGVVALLIPLTIAGIASIGPAVMVHEGSTLLVVFNALRLLAYRDHA